VSALRIEGHILTPQGFVRGVLEHEEGRITRVEGTLRTEDQARSEAQGLVLPGFIDTHVHGGGGSDTMEGGEAIGRIARLHARHGTTSLLATTMTAPLSEVEAAMRALAPACASRAPGAARVLGVHLEGPYINPGKLGAQPDFVRPASIDEIHALNALAPVRLITLAPELPGNLDIIVVLRAAGFQVQIGHTLGSYEDGVAALERGDAVLVAAERVADLDLESGGAQHDDDIEIAWQLRRQRDQPDRCQRIERVDFVDRCWADEVGLCAEFSRVDVRAFQMHAEHARRTGCTTRAGRRQRPHRRFHLG